ncbi:hypothetical protein DFP72DRAFT_922800 [Ephemerocybe angulata]|uniref:Uncharacterized protein n=1 Tax=Ephemerocybe angulata TaxID=980116 RepID=A0A8H6HHI9_9AGAR|nr:hypothetical protein DFP72DRAFT_922800 [Tulosesus angulatus]
MRFNSLAGFPATTTLLSTSFVTTLPAPTVTPSPIVTPGHIIAPAPIQQSAPMLTGTAHSRPCMPLRSSGTMGCCGVSIWTLGPTRVRGPIVTGHTSRIVQLVPINTPSPIVTLNPYSAKIGPIFANTPSQLKNPFKRAVLFASSRSSLIACSFWRWVEAIRWI